MSKVIEIRIKEEQPFYFKGINSDGTVTYTDAAGFKGVENRSFKPMEMILLGLAGCASVDALVILKKQRQKVDAYEVRVAGTRVDTVPAVYEDIKLHFKLWGRLDAQKVEAAIALSIEKYCSVATMLERGGVKISWTSEVCS
ncbi:MAG: OsmC family protein [Fibrobacter sp.]|nr:OsmC family protein [Fibrobacter sp.]